MSDLDKQIALLSKAYKPIYKARLAETIAAHHRVVRTDPAILIGALVEWCADGCTQLRQYWDRVDKVSERVRGRYHLKENDDELDADL